MAHSAVAQFSVVTLGDAGIVPFADGKRDKIVGLALQCRGNRRGHGSDRAFDVLQRDGVLPYQGITDAVWRLGDIGRAHYIRSRNGLHRSSLRHSSRILPYAGGLLCKSRTGDGDMT